MQMNIAQALTYQKRVAEALVKVSTDIKTYNSVAVFEGGTAVEARQQVDIRALLARRTVLKEHLVQLKLALWNASQSIRPLILNLAELKDDASFWAGIDTKVGKHKLGYADDSPTLYDAEIKKADVDAKSVEIKKAIDRIQSEIDTFNHTHTLTIEDIGV